MTVAEARSLAGRSVEATRAGGADLARNVQEFADRLPDAIDVALSGAQQTTSSLQTMPDPTLRILAAASLGFAAGLYLAGAPRLITLAAIAPAVIVGSAIVSRPGRIHISRQG